MERKFTADWSFRTPERTIDFRKGQTPLDAEVLAAAEAAGVLETKDGDDRTAKGSAAGRTVNLKG